MYFCTVFCTVSKRRKKVKTVKDFLYKFFVLFWELYCFGTFPTHSADCFEVNWTWKGDQMFQRTCRTRIELNEAKRDLFKMMKYYKFNPFERNQGGHKLSNLEKEIEWSPAFD